MAEMLSKLKTWWKEILFLFSGAVLLSFFDQLGWVAAAVIGAILLVVGMLFLVYDLGRKAASRTPKKEVTGPGESKERVLETVVEVDEGEDYEDVAYYFEKGQRILVEADSRVHGGRFSLLVIHESELPIYEKDEGPYSLVSENWTTLHRERLEILESGLWHFIIEPERGEDVSVELSVWKLPGLMG